MADYNVMTHSDMVTAGRSHYQGRAARAPEHHYIEATMIELTTNQSYDFVGVVPAWSDREPLYIFTSTLVLRDQDEKHLAVGRDRPGPQASSASTSTS